MAGSGISDITQAALHAQGDYLIQTAAEMKLLKSSRCTAERRESAGLMERFNKSMGRAHAFGYV